MVSVLTFISKHKQKLNHTCLTWENKPHWFRWYVKSATLCIRMSLISFCGISNVPHHFQEWISLVVVESQKCHITHKIESHWWLWYLKCATSLAGMNLIGCCGMSKVSSHYSQDWISLDVVEMSKVPHHSWDWILLVVVESQMCHITHKIEFHWLLWNVKCATSLVGINLIGSCGTSNVSHHLWDWISLVVVESQICHITRKIESHWFSCINQSNVWAFVTKLKCCKH